MTGVCDLKHTVEETGNLLLPILKELRGSCQISWMQFPTASPSES